MGLRDMIDTIAPPWLRVGGVQSDASKAGAGGRLLYSMAVVVDAMIEKVTQAVKARMPTKTETDSSLPYIGLDRLIPRGLSETTAEYGIRLRRAFDDWFYAGAPRALIAQELGYVSPATPRVLVVSNTSAWDYVPAGSDPTTVPTHLPAAAAVMPTANWDWDSVSLAPYSATFWWRIWLIIDATGWVTATRKYGDGVAKYGDPRYSYGLDAPSSVGQSIQAIAKLWKSQHAWIRWIIVCIDSSEFIPTDAPGAGSLPDGTWGYGEKLVAVGPRIERHISRSSKARYMDGVI